MLEEKVGSLIVSPPERRAPGERCFSYWHVGARAFIRVSVSLLELQLLVGNSIWDVLNIGFSCPRGRSRLMRKTFSSYIIFENF